MAIRPDVFPPSPPGDLQAQSTRDVGARLGALVLALNFLAVGAALLQQKAPVWEWIGPGLHLLLGSTFGVWAARRFPDPKRAERIGLLTDHFLAGVWVVLIGFNALPSALLVTGLVCAGAGRVVWRRGLPGFAAGGLVGLALFGFRWWPATDLATLLACMPALLAQPLAVGYAARLQIRRLQRNRADLEFQNRHDGLSALFNRAHWETLLRNEFARFRRSGEPATLVLADLDHFKRINDTLGHAAGDAVIRRFANLLRLSLRETDSAGRYGGEEFGVLLPHTTAEAACDMVERLRHALHDRPLLEGKVVTASFGIAQLTSDIDTYAAWLNRADRMLYQAKNGGRDRVVVHGAASVEADRGTESNHALPSAGVLDALRDPAVLPHLLAGLDMSEAPLALFDSADKLVLANLAFTKAYAVPPGEQSFAAVMRNCYVNRVGARIATDDIEAWLKMAGAKRRSRPRRSFAIDMVDGRWFWAIETAFNNGWVLVTLNDITDTTLGPAPADPKAPVTLQLVPRPSPTARRRFEAAKQRAAGEAERG
jgi:diguanylate cyclase (GGDEF)-like protein